MDSKSHGVMWEGDIRGPIVISEGQRLHLTHQVDLCTCSWLLVRGVLALWFITLNRYSYLASSPVDCWLLSYTISLFILVHLSAMGQLVYGPSLPSSRISFGYAFSIPNADSPCLLFYSSNTETENFGPLYVVICSCIMLNFACKVVGHRIQLLSFLAVIRDL